MLAVAIVYLHYVVEGRMEEGKLAKHHCGGDKAWEPQCRGLAGCGGAWGGDGGLLLALGLSSAAEGSYWCRGQQLVCFSAATLARDNPGHRDTDSWGVPGWSPQGSRQHSQEPRSGWVEAA